MILDYHLSIHLCKACILAVSAVELPANALQYLPVLKGEIEAHWPDTFRRAYFGGQVEQETCISLKHRKCWSPTAELKTDREYGFGLGQITVTASFNNFEEARKLHPSLADWTWDNRYNAQYQLRSMVLKDKFNHGKFSWAVNERERMAFTFASYNGGIGGVLSDKRVCSTTPNCLTDRWFGNVEHTSRKAKVAAKGYGKSFFEINREYVVNVMTVRHQKYIPHLGGPHD